MNARHATLHDVMTRRPQGEGFAIVAARPARHGGFTIHPARLDLHGGSFSPSFPLGKLPPGRIPPVLRVPIQKGYDVAWVRARLPSVFGFTPEPSEVEKTILWQDFVAVPDGADEGVAFVCSDYYGRTSLFFSPNEVDEALKGRAADAFWSLLLAEPDALSDFSHRDVHLGGGFRLEYGCRDGEPYYIEEDDGAGEDGGEDE